MALFFQQLVDGLASGSIYAFLALALVLIYRSTGVLNFAQGEMAMLATYAAWSLTGAGFPVFAAIAIAMLLAFGGGVTIERLLIRRVEQASVLAVVIVTLGLFVAINAIAGFHWGYTEKSMPSAFPSDLIKISNVTLDTESFGVLATLLVVVALLYVLFQFTKVGLAMRASASNPESSRLVGIRVERMLMLGWGLAAGLGALAGAMVAPKLFLDPNMMQGVLLYAFAAAALGGFDSPVGAVVGGLIVGVTENMAGTYVHFIRADLKLLVALVLIFVVLLVRPSGLFGKRTVVRV